MYEYMHTYLYLHTNIYIHIHTYIHTHVNLYRFLLQEQIRVILHAFNINRKECIKALFELPFSSRFPMEYLIVEVIISEIFKLPHPSHPVVYYYVILLGNVCESYIFNTFFVVVFICSNTKVKY